MITLRKTVSLSLDINDINEAVNLFLKEKGFEAFDKVTIENLQKIVDGGQLVLDAREIINIEASSRIPESPANEEEPHISFPDSIISRISSCTMGLEMFLHNVDANQVQQILNKCFYSKLDLNERCLLYFIFNLDLKNPGSQKMKNLGEIEEYLLSQKSNIKLEVKKVISKFGKCVLADFQTVLSDDSLTAKLNLPKEELLKLRVRDMSFSTRAHNALKRYDIENIEMLKNLDFVEFKKTRQAGEITFQEIQNFIQLYKLNSES